MVRSVRLMWILTMVGRDEVRAGVAERVNDAVDRTEDVSFSRRDDLGGEEPTEQGIIDALAAKGYEAVPYGLPVASIPAAKEATNREVAAIGSATRGDVAVAGASDAGSTSA
jgi:hypothetical protein